MSCRVKVAVIMLAVLTLCTFALIAGVSAFLNSARARALLLNKLSASIPGTVTAADHRVSLLTGEILIRDVRIRDSHGKTPAGFKRLNIDLSLASILRKALIIEAVELEHPWVRLEKDERGRLNILDAVYTSETKPSPSPESSPSFNVLIEHFHMSGGALSFVSGDIEIELARVNLTANGNLAERSAILRLDIGESVIAYDTYQSKFKKFDLALAMNKGEIEPVVINVENQFATLLLYGDVKKALSDPDLDLHLKIDTELEEMTSFFNFDHGSTGRLNAYLTVKGKAGNPDLGLRVEYNGGSLAGRDVRFFECSSKVSDRVVSIDRLIAKTGFGNLYFGGKIDLQSVFPDGVFSPSPNFEKAAYDGRLRADALNLSLIGPVAEKSTGILDAEVSFRGRVGTVQSRQLEAAVDASIAGFSWGEMLQPMDIQLGMVGGLQGESVRLHHLEADAEGLFFTADGGLELENEQIDARFSLNTDQVSGPLALLGMQGAGGLRLNGRVTGSLQNPLLQTTAAGKAIRIPGVSIGDIDVEASLDEKGSLTVSSLSVANNGSSIKGAGKLQLFDPPFKRHPEMPLEAGFVFSDLEYGDFITGLGIKGLLGGRLDIEGSVHSLKAAAEIAVHELAVGRIRLGNLAGIFKFRGGTLFADSLKLTNNSTTLSLKGQADLFQEGSWHILQSPGVRLSLSDSRVHLEDFLDGMQGTMAIEAELHGDLRRPQGSIRVGGRRLDLGLQRVEVLTFEAVSDDGGITIDRFDISLPGGSDMVGSGRFGFDRSFQFRVRAEDFALENVDRVREMEFVEGRLAFDVTGKGHIENPEIDGTARLTEILINEESVEDLTVRFGLKGKGAVVKATQAFDLDAGYDLLDKTYSVNLTLKNTSLAPWFVIAGRPELGGTISGKVRADGYTGDLKQSRATVDIDSLAVDFKKESMVIAENIQGTLAKQQFEIPGFRVRLLDQGHFSVKGSGDISGAVNMEVEGDIPLKTAQMFLKDLPEIKGKLALKTSVAGTFKEPRLSGEIRIEQGGMQIPELQQEFSNVNGRVTLTSEDEIEGELSGLLDDGVFDLSGKIVMEGFLPQRVKAKIRAVSLPFKIPETMDMLLNVDLSVNGTTSDMLVGGKFILLEGSYYKDFKINLMEKLQTTKREVSPFKGGFDSPLLKPLRFDIHIENRQPFVVDNNIADLEISPDIRLTGTPENPIVTGSAIVDSGVITYQNKSFVVDRGAVDFVNPYKTEAEIDIKGEVEIREWRITILVHGPPDRLVVELSSSPHEEDADIISLLVFNKTTYELNEGSSGVAQSPTVLLAKLLASSYGDEIKKSTGIDILEVEAESAGDETSTDRIMVTVGKNLSERMTVKYSVESKDGGYVQRATTEYKLLEHILVSGFQDTKGRYGGELIFRVAFRLFR